MYSTIFYIINYILILIKPYIFIIQTKKKKKKKKKKLFNLFSFF